MKKVVCHIYFLLMVTNLWSQISLINTGTNEMLRVFIEKENKKIIINGHQSYLKSSNDECSTFNPLSIPEISNFSLLEIVDTNVFYMSTSSSLLDGKIYKSIDGGHNWVMKYGSTTHRPYGTSFFDVNEGIAFAGLHQITRTTDGGDNWTYEYFSPLGITAVKIIGDSAIFTGPSGGGIGYSKNRGQTWNFWSGLAQQNSISQFYFLNADTGFATTGKGNFGPYLATCFNTQGNSWQIKAIPIYAANGIYFKNINEGYVVGKLNDTIGTILKTTDLGNTWLRYKTGIKTELIDIKPLNDSIYLISGTNGVLFKWNSKQTIFTGIQDYNLNTIDVKIFPNPEKINLDYNLKIIRR